MKKLLTLLSSTLFIITLLHATTYPTIYAQMGDPLFQASEQLNNLAKFDTLSRPILDYKAHRDQVLTFGIAAQKSSDKKVKKSYLKKLRLLQKEYDSLVKKLQKSLIQTIRDDQYRAFLPLAESANDIFYKDDRLRSKIFAYYSANRIHKHSAILDELITKDANTRKVYNTYKHSNKSYNTSARVGRHEVLLLSTPHCPYCKKAKSFLRSEGVTFKEYNINASTKGKTLYRQHHGQGVPVVIIDGRAIHGFNIKAMQKALR